MKNQTLYTEVFQINDRDYLVGATDEGLAYFGYPEAEECRKFFKGYQIVAEGNSFTRQAGSQLTEYFAGERQQFQLPLDLVGTEFQRQVWQGLLQVPFGETVSYSQLAEELQRPQSVRAVANAVGRNPLMVVVPCHRVLGKDGSLTGFRGGLPLKITLLELEGVTNFR